MKQALVLAGIITLSVCGCKNSEPEGTIFVSGRIDGDSVDLSSKIAGRVAELTVREGDSVKAGSDSRQTRQRTERSCSRHAELPDCFRPAQSGTTAAGTTDLRRENQAGHNIRKPGWCRCGPPRRCAKPGRLDSRQAAPKWCGPGLTWCDGKRSCGRPRPMHNDMPL